MLVLVGPPFGGSEEEYARVAQAAGVVPYDVKTRLKPGSWGVVRALADAEQAAALARKLRDEGLRAIAVDPDLVNDPERRIVSLTALELQGPTATLHLQDRVMQVPYGALMLVVRGEVHVGSPPRSLGSPGSSSSTFRAVAPVAAEQAVFREQVSTSDYDAFAAADLHFVTVPWVARIDARTFDFSVLGESIAAPVQALDRLVDLLAERTGIRVDRSHRASSVPAYAVRTVSRVATPPPRSTTGSHTPQSSPRNPAPRDERFDGYSLLVAEAERLTLDVGP